MEETIIPLSDNSSYDHDDDGVDPLLQEHWKYIQSQGIDLNSYNDSLWISYVNETRKAQDCKRLYLNQSLTLLAEHPEGICNSSYDSISCWPPTAVNTTAVLKCFREFLGIKYDDTREYVYDFV